ncbi:MAG: hypothetical protein DWQ34_00610 [Planctomycetota bacterium]|nr:MAG: hypothetical protein DWQ34_00610 [Planctomycetota bacterium]REK25656.1 MAG: hypothetical protein DWQ41_12040 [Planctomycetota bacterium]REK31632.1 MAG: hypothetical protein DWQ45_18645 [Planctomycetota bacterium]
MADEETDAASEQLKHLTEFGKRIKTAYGLILSLVMALPLAGLKWDFWVPPWPPYSVVLSTIVALVWVVAIACVHQGTASTGFRDWLKWHAVGAVASLCVYVSLLATFTGTVGSHRYLSSPWLTTGATTAIETGVVQSDVTSLLIEYGNADEDQNEIWRWRPLFKTLLLLTFFAILVGTGSFFAFLVLKGMAIDREAGN